MAAGERGSGPFRLQNGDFINMNRAYLRLFSAVVLLFAMTACNRSPEARRDRYIAKGKELLQKKDYQRAALEFLNATQVMPKDAESYYQLGSAYLASGDVSKGVASLRKALQLNPKHTGAQLRMAQLMTNVSDPAILKDAQERLRALLQDSPENPDVLHALALTELKLGDPEQATQHLEQAMAAAPQELILPMTLADAKLQQKDFKGAEEVLSKACEKSPKSSDCVVVLGRLYLIENRPKDAEQKFRQAVGMNPKNSGALLNIALLESATGRKQEAEQDFKRLSSLPDRTFKPYHAMFLFQQGQREEALKEFEALYRQDPTDRMARTRLVVAYQAVNRSADAHKLLSDALKNNPKDLDALLQRGEMSLGEAKYPEAEEDLNRVLHLRPDSPEVHYALAKLYQARGATQRQQEELVEVLRQNPSLLQARLDLAASWIQENAGKAAIDVLDGAPSNQKDLLRFVEQRNWALLSAGQIAEARKGVSLGLGSARSLDLLMQDAILKMNEKRFGEARDSLHEAMTKSPEDLRVLRLLVRTYAAQNQVPAAIQELRAHSAKNPKSAAIQYFLGTMLLETGDRDQARQAFNAAKALQPDYAPADLSLAQVNLLQANWNDARQELNNILTSKGETAQARQWLGMLEAAAGSSEAAIGDFRKVLQSQPNNATALNNLAFLLAENGHADEALPFAEKAVELAPDKPDFEDTLGWVLYRKGLFAAAITHLQAAVSKSGDTRYQYHLATAYFRKGDSVRGHAILTAALRKAPNLPEARLAQEAAQQISQR